MDKKLLFSVIGQQALERPAHTAISSGKGAITYHELGLYVDRLALQLVRGGLQKGEVVGVFLPKSTYYVVVILAVNKAGGIFMPVEMNYPEKRLQEILAFVQPRFIVTRQEHAVRLSAFSAVLAGTPALYLTDDFHIAGFPQHSGQPDNPGEWPALNGDDSCYLIYTSGSTGKPKIIEGVHKSLSHFIHWEVKEFGLSGETNTGMLAPVSFDVSLRDIFTPLLAGGTLFIPDDDLQLDVRKLVDWIHSSALTVLHIVPSVFRLLITALNQMSNPAAKIGSLNYILLAGEPLYGRDVLAWRKIAGGHTELVNVYGPSETTLAKLFFRIQSFDFHADNIIPLGVPLPNTSVAIVNNGRLCNVGDTGEIYIRTPFRTKGYYRDPELTNEKFIQNPLHSDSADIVYKTGDLGKYSTGNEVVFVGRNDSQVKIRGNRVELPEVEKCIAQYPGIQQTVVLPLERKEKELVLCCYFTGAETTAENQLKAYLEKRLPDYMIPSYFIQLDAFPLNLNGKVNKRELPRPEEILYERLSYQAPTNTMEEKIASIWSEMLGLRRVGIDNSFFELGGYSLIATKIIAKISYVLNKDLSFRDFFEHTTVRKLAALLYARSERQQDPIPVIDRSREYYDVSFGQKRILIQTGRSGQHALYNMPLAFRFSGRLDLAVLKQVFDRLILRHESLRTTFHEVAGALCQKVHLQMDLSIREHEVPEGQEARVTETRVAELLQTDFDLEQGPLLAVHVVKFSADRFLLLFNIHHLIADGWSLGVFFREFVFLYNHIGRASPENLPPLPVQYLDYVYWIKEKLSSGRLSDAGKFWHNIIGNAASSAQIPADFPRTPDTGYNGRKHSFYFSEAESDSIRRLCMYHEVSLHVYLLSIIYILLFKRSGQRRIAVGTPSAGRMHADLHNQIGNYINNLVLVAELLPEEQFASFLARVKAIAFEAFDHQAYPYDLLADELMAGAPASANPFYNVLVVTNEEGLMSEKEDLSLLGGEIAVESVKIEEEFSKLDLSFFCYDKKEITISIEYNTDLFRKGSLLKMEDAIRELVSVVEKEKEKPVYDLVAHIAGKEERELKGLIALHNISEIEEAF